MPKLISIVIPVYNEEKNIPLILAKLKNTFDKLKEYTYEIIFINDGSKDKSGLIIKNFAKKNKKIKYIEFSRNFGKEIATSAGMRQAKGKAAIMIDADLQHPICLIPKFLEKWKNGVEVVVGIRKKNKGEGLIKKIGSLFFYAIISTISKDKITQRATDYRLLDRVVIDELNKFTERNRMTRALIDWLGFKRDYVYFEADERKHGEAGYNVWKLIKLAVNSFVSLSLMPLRVAGYLGIVITLFSGSLGIFMLIEKYILHDPFNLHFSGSAMLAVMTLFLVGIILSSLGLISLYIASIHGEVMNRPMYVIRSKKI